MITKFDSLFAGHIDMENAGYGGTAVNDRRFPNEDLATVFDKAKMAPFVPGGEALFYEPRTGDPKHDEPRDFCMPAGFPASVLSGNAIKNISGSVLDELVVTDTLPLRPDAQACPKIRQLKIAGLLAETIRRISAEESVSSLYVD